MTKARACAIIIKILQRTKMYYIKRTENMNGVDGYNGAGYMVFGAARFSVFKKQLRFSKGD